jgi:hypothetical protein
LAVLHGDRLVLAELHRWWLTALRSHPERVADGVDHDEYVNITYSGGSRIHAARIVHFAPRDFASDRCRWLIFKSLVPSYDAREAADSCEEDWLNDSKGAAVLNRSLFLDAVSLRLRAKRQPCCVHRAHSNAQPAHTPPLSPRRSSLSSQTPGRLEWSLKSMSPSCAPSSQT